MALDNRRHMTPEDITRIVWVSDPQISPDGRRVAYVATTLSEEKDQYQSQIWMVDTAGGAPRRFTAGPRRDTEPRWSPDGGRLAFVSEREAKKKGQLYVMPADGGEPTPLSDLKNGVTNPVWSPDGTRIGFVARVGGWQEPDSEEEKQKSRPPRVITSLNYRYNGEGFTYDRRPHVFVVSADGVSPGRSPPATGSTPSAWSPDGRLIVFSSARHAEKDDDDASDLWLVGAEAGEPRRVTDTAGPTGLASFSPDGRTIAYLGRRARNDFGGNVRVFTVPADGGGLPTCLTMGPTLLRAAPRQTALVGGRPMGHLRRRGSWRPLDLSRGHLSRYRARTGDRGRARRHRVLDLPRWPDAGVRRYRSGHARGGLRRRRGRQWRAAADRCEPRVARGGCPLVPRAL
jgi:WD40 repeat protein